MRQLWILSCFVTIFTGKGLLTFFPTGGQFTTKSPLRILNVYPGQLERDRVLIGETHVQAQELLISLTTGSQFIALGI